MVDHKKILRKKSCNANEKTFSAKFMNINAPQSVSPFPYTNNVCKGTDSVGPIINGKYTVAKIKN